MWISRKKYKGLEKRITDLEEKVQGRNTVLKVRLKSTECNTDDLIKKYNQLGEMNILTR